MTSPLLTYDDRHGPGMVKLRKHLESELSGLRRRNDKDRPETETAWIRGEIARVKAMQALLDEPKKEKLPSE